MTKILGYMACPNPWCAARVEIRRGKNVAYTDCDGKADDKKCKTRIYFKEAATDLFEQSAKQAQDAPETANDNEPDPDRAKYKEAKPDEPTRLREPEPEPVAKPRAWYE